MKATYRKTGHHYEGVIRDGKTIVWACGHPHNNRDEDTTRNSAAVPCATRVLDAITDRDKFVTRIKNYHEYLRTAYFPKEYMARHAHNGLRVIEWALTIADGLRASTEIAA